MATLTPEQRQKKWEEIALHNVTLQVEHLREDHRLLGTGTTSRSSICFHVQEVIRALRRFEESMESTYSDDEFPDEFDEDPEEPILL